MAQPIKYPVVNGKKECGDCGEWKEISDYRKARNHYVSRCRSCLKIYAAEYRKRPESKIASQKYHIEYMKNSANRNRANERQRKYNKTEKYKKNRNKNRREWSNVQKQKAVNYKGGECCICKYNTCLAALEFHHVDPSKKNGYGTGALKAHWSFKKNKPELDKCILVCVRCHREIHAGLHKDYIA
ncbi:MAG: hypothetical protein GY938_16905 [Ketobacter sp.]|nr:hypothetical protein [Ketobacter sp.]